MPEGKKPAIAVVDVGKTNAKIIAVLHDGTADATASFAHEPKADSRYRALDTDAIWQWLIGELTKLASRYEISKIVTTAHGATAALIDDDGLVMPVLDYEDDGPDAIEDTYAKLRPPFTETYSAPLPGSLNFGKGLYWQFMKWPQDFARAKHILCYAQYWSWMLSGVPALETSSIGSHSDLWTPKEKRFSSLVGKLGWKDLFPALRHASDVLGPVRPELAAKTGLDPSCEVLCGIHDSNASLLMWMDRQKPFTVISTGTWVIIFSVGGSLDSLDSARDCVANVTIEGEPIACCRWMGGREYANLREGLGDVQAEFKDITDTMFTRKMYLPGQGGRGGPMPDREGGSLRMEGATDIEKAAAAEAYCAMMVRECLKLCTKTREIIIEGPFAGNRNFGALVASMHPGQKVYASMDATGTATGAAKLALPDLKPPRVVHRKPVEIRNKLKKYEKQWLSGIDEDAEKSEERPKPLEELMRTSRRRSW